jgi:DNA adenine methylase
VIFEYDDFGAIASRLRHATILCSDFEKVVEMAGENDFLFVDPPYTVKHDYNGFIKYNQRLFNWDDQLRLKRSIERAADRGALVLIANANHTREVVPVVCAKIPLR